MPNYLISKTIARRYASGSIFSALALVTSLVPAPASAAEIYGQITLDGKAVASKQILINGTPVGQTDISGGYRLNLPPGQYTLAIEGKSVPIVVPPPGGKKDIPLK